jgi:FkbM family methyltransferase
MTIYKKSPYEKIQFRFTKLKIKFGLALNQHDCELIRNHYRSTHDKSREFTISEARAFRTDLGKFKVHIRKNSSDIGVMYQVIIKNQYGAVSDLIKKMQGKSIRTIIDGGANIGLATLHFKKNFPAAHVIALEPDESNYKMFIKNIHCNELKGITPLKAGLWKSRKQLRVIRNIGDGREWAFGVEETQVEDKDTVTGYGIMDLVNDNGWDTIDLLKIDIEGSERFLFEEDRAVSEFLSRTRFLAIEIHDQFVSRTKIINLLEANNFTHFQSGELTIAFNKSLN